MSGLAHQSWKGPGATPPSVRAALQPFPRQHLSVLRGSIAESERAAEGQIHPPSPREWVLPAGQRLDAMVDQPRWAPEHHHIAALELPASNRVPPIKCLSQ
jgi:hypothetical protein